MPFVSIDGTTLQGTFSEDLSLEGMTASAFRLVAIDPGAVPISVQSVVPDLTTVQSGSQGQVGSLWPPSKVFDACGGAFTGSHVGDYLIITGTSEAPYRITAVSGTLLTLDRPLLVVYPYAKGDPATPGVPESLAQSLSLVEGLQVHQNGNLASSTIGDLEWEHVKVDGVTLVTNKSTNGKSYRVEVSLKAKSGVPYLTQDDFVAVADKPRLGSVEFIPEGGSVLLTFDTPMRLDSVLTSPDEYSLSGPGSAEVTSVRTLDDRRVALSVSGMQAGSYTVEVNASGTPKDVAGNPIDPTFNQAVFTATVPIRTRSVFTDLGPISKPELTLMSGVGATIQTSTIAYQGQVTLNEVILTGATLSSTHVGKYVDLTDTAVNLGTYKVLAVLSPVRARLEASLRLPDADNGDISWRLFDPRHGEIADDPSDVVVRVNGTPVTPDAVIGLLGQVVLPSAPSSSDDVKIDYSWVPDPTVEVRRLNSREFKLNGWLHDTGRQTSNQHTYRYRNVLVSPSTFASDNLLAEQAQPLLRELSYRAYERAYTASLNDPSLLLLNTPLHRVAYPPMSRQVPETSVSYSADTLPEADPTSPWERKGLGLASASSGLLTVQDNTGSAYPTGNPLFWVRGGDFTFQHVFALTWRMHVTSYTPVGVFTGVSVGWSDEVKAAVVGFLDDSGVRKIGFLKKGSGNDPSLLTSWVGGLLSDVPVDFDWSTPHSYRILRDRDGVIRLYVDGEVTEILRATSDDLPFLEELDDPFDQIQGVFFGSLSRQAQNVSVWDFVRYLVLPTNPQQSEPAIFVGYDGDVLPEEASYPWTPIGYHGNETLSGGTLILDSTSATSVVDVGTIGGDFKGFTRIEPLLQVSSDVVLDLGVQLRTYTHGITHNAVMAAVDDGSRLIQLCFFPTRGQPKYSYPGRSLPDDASPNPWTALGGESARMVGQTLIIDDTSSSDGLVYALTDSEPDGSSSRVLESTNDYYIEVKTKVLSYTTDGAVEGFCGLTVDTFDGLRTIGLMARETTLGVRRLAFHSDGLLLGPSAQFDFDWNDGNVHIIRIVKSTLGNLVSLFVDGTLLGTAAYTSFATATGNPMISFGSSTAISSGSTSVVEWHYVNTWRGQPTAGVRKYVGVWKGFDNEELTGYYLPLRVSGHAAVAGNTITDTSVNFITLGVSIGDDLVVDVGTNKGTYEIASVGSTTLTVVGSFLGPSEVDYRIPSQTDWSYSHRYRIVRDPGGAVSLLFDSQTDPLIRIDYNEVTLPSSTLGLPRSIAGGLPSITWGAFDSENISQVAWDFVRYGVTRSVTEMRIVPHHQNLNQHNVMSSPEKTSVAHGRTSFTSSSTGIPYPWREYVDNVLVTPFTALNEGTPIVPQTQSYEVRRPTPQVTFLSGLNRPEDVLNSDGDFLLNDASTEVRLLVPRDVLYDSLEVVTRSTGDEDYIAPFSDEVNPVAFRQLSWTKEVCGIYSGDAIPEQDSGFGSAWVLESDTPGSVSATVFSGVLTYGSGNSVGNTIYRNPTPLTDPVGLSTKVDFRLKVLNDSSSGTGDTGIRFGFSAFGTITAALSFVSNPLGDREVRLLDLATETTVASIGFDFLDGAFHTYRLEKNVADGTVDFLIDP
jgi:hypothetical protein